MFVREWFSERVPMEYSYHTFEHTEKVVAETIELCKAEKLDDLSTFKLAIASWFHDTGFGLAKENHEMNSCIVLNEFGRTFPELTEFLPEISALIMATEYARKPQNLFEMILRDADLHYLGTSDYKEEASALRLEWASILGKVYSDREWLQINVDFLREHQYYTSSASHKFEATKRYNLSEVEKLFFSS